MDDVVPMLIKCRVIKAAIYCCVMKSRTCTDDVDQKKYCYDIVFGIINAIESSKTSTPQEVPQSSGENFGALLWSMINRFDSKKKDGALIACLEQLSYVNEREMLLNLLTNFLEQPETKICDDLIKALENCKL